jgi:hypothetical protein
MLIDLPECPRSGHPARRDLRREKDEGKQRKAEERRKAERKQDLSPLSSAPP